MSLPDDLAEETDALAQSLGKTRSEVVGGALRRQVKIASFAEPRRYGRERAEGTCPSLADRRVIYVTTIIREG